MKRLWGIRHVRYYWHAYRVVRHAQMWGALGIGLGIPNQGDVDILAPSGTAGPKGGAMPRWGEHDEQLYPDLSPERALIAAMLRGVVADARSRAKCGRTAREGAKNAQRIAEAQAWLRDREAVLWWLELVGLPEATYTRLLEAAGLEGTTEKEGAHGETCP